MSDLTGLPSGVEHPVIVGESDGVEWAKTTRRVAKAPLSITDSVARLAYVLGSQREGHAP